MREGKTKSNTRKKYESELISIAKRGQGAIAPCGVQRQRLWWGLGQRPNRSAGDHSKGKVNKAQAAKRPCQ